jgi:hypothetical protein
MDELVVVMVLGYRHEAELAKGFLDDAGIEAVIQKDDASGLETGLSFTSPAKLIVHKDDLNQARQILRAAGVLPPDGSTHST